MIMKFQPIVADVPSNHEGITLAANQVSLLYKDDSGVVQTASNESDTVKLVEPDLEIERLFKPTSSWRGETVTCILSVRHSPSSTADAYDVDIQESLPQGLSYVPGSLEIVNGPDGTTSDSESLIWHFLDIDRSWNSNHKIELSYKAILESQVQAATSLSCRADLSWTSTAGENPAERAYHKTPRAGPARPHRPGPANQPLRQPRPGSPGRHSSLHHIL